MTTRVDPCAICGESFEQERKQGRPRHYCDSCAAPKPAPKPKQIVRGLRPDPPVRPDRCCVVCLKPLVFGVQARRYAGHRLDDEPFCSTPCCRQWHGVEFNAEPDEERVAA